MQTTHPAAPVPSPMQPELADLLQRRMCEFNPTPQVGPRTSSSVLPEAFWARAWQKSTPHLAACCALYLPRPQL